MLRFFGSVSNLPLLTIGDHYHSHDKMVKGNGDRAGIWYGYLVGVRGCIPLSMGHSLVTLFSLSVLVKDRPLHWVLGKSQIYCPERILEYGRRKDLLLSCRGSGSFRTD